MGCFLFVSLETNFKLMGKNYFELKSFCYKEKKITLKGIHKKNQSLNQNWMVFLLAWLLNFFPYNIWPIDMNSISLKLPNTVQKAEKRP